MAPDYCEDCEDEPPEFYITFVSPKERVYYCLDCYLKHKEDPKVLGTGTVQ